MTNDSINERTEKFDNLGTTEATNTIFFLQHLATRNHLYTFYPDAFQQGLILS